MIVKNARFFYDGKIVVEKDILVDKKIKKIGIFDGKGEEKFDAKGMFVFPGLVDAHVHLREPGAEHKENFESGGRAAIAGGITTIIDMPNNPKPTITIPRVKEKIKLAKSSLARVYFHFGATKNNFAEVKKAERIEGVRGLKIYMGKTTGDLLVDDEQNIIKHLKNFKKTIVFHAEDEETINAMEKEKMKRWPAGIVGIAKACALGKIANAKIHIAHATSYEEVMLAKMFGASVETAPHYLFLDESATEKWGGVNPPLREREVVEKLWRIISKIDCISTDHAPHTKKEKTEGAKGYPGLETSLALMLTAYSKGLITLDEIEEKMAENPARIFGLNGIGRIKEGFVGDLTIVDLNKEWVVKGEELNTKCKWSPFEGMKLRGKVKAVIKEGRLIYEDGNFFA
ncbi:MAG: dihydroorotase family protein [Candidatus Anstonellales archaeon]